MYVKVRDSRDVHSFWLYIGQDSKKHEENEPEDELQAMERTHGRRRVVDHCRRKKCIPETLDLLEMAGQLHGHTVRFHIPENTSDASLERRKLRRRLTK